MKNKTKLVIVLLDVDELIAFFPEWPDAISLAVCLLPTGEHHFVFFHVSETHIICGRLEQMLNISNSELEITPKVDGYETRPMLFSDNQLIWSLISDSPDALEEAVDYADNYRFAVEEGLELADFWGLDNESRDNTSGNQSVPEKLHANDKVLVREPTTISHLQGLSQASENIECGQSSGTISRPIPSFLSASQAKPNPGFFCVAELEKMPPRNKKWTVHPEQDGFIVFEVSENPSVTLRIEHQEQLYVSKDITKLAIRNTVIATNPIRPTRLEIKTDILPQKIRADLGVRITSASLQERGYFLYFTLEDLSNEADGLIEKDFWESGKAGRSLKLNFRPTFINSLARFTKSPFNLAKPSFRTAALIMLAIGVTGLLSEATAVSFLR